MSHEDLERRYRLLGTPAGTDRLRSGDAVPPVPQEVKAAGVLAYCPRCDLTFCEAHRGDHPESCRGTPTEELAAQYGAKFCSVCAGIWRV